MSAPLRVALDAADAERRQALLRALTTAGHVFVDGGGAADVRLVDLPPGGIPPAGSVPPVLVLTEQAGVASDPAVAGVLPRTTGPSRLDAALRAVAAGLQVRAPGPTEPAGFAAAAAEEAMTGLLTPREVEVLTAIGDGLSNKEVARRLGISAHTVKFHLESLFSKLDVGSRAEAVAKGLRRGLIEL